LYHSYIGKVILCGIFWWFYWSLSSLSNHFSYIFKWVWHLFYDLDYYPWMLGLLDIDCSCTFHSFLAGWSPYFLVDHLHKQKFASRPINVPSNVMRAHLHSYVGPGADMWLLVCPTTPTFHLSLTHFLVALMSWFTTSYGCPPFIMLMWSYHWRSKYPFTLVSLHEWTYSSPWYISEYYCNYCFGKWNTCSKGGLPLFPSLHSTMNRYLYHQKWFLNLAKHHHCWPNLSKHGAMSIDDNNTCNDDGCSRKIMIMHWTNIRWWLHSLCYWNVWVISFLFWFIFDRLFIDHYCVSLVFFFSPTQCLCLIIDNMCP